MAKKKQVKKEAVTTAKAAAKTIPEAAIASPQPIVEEPLQDRTWLAGAGAVILIAAFLRFYDLALKPFHHDEGVNGFFLKSLFNDGMYKYDPSNYHGPTLYYISLVFTKLFGFETIPVRLSMAIFGVLMVVMVLFLRRYIGRIGSIAAALFLALSPGMVFISRYFIHEILFVFLSLGVVVGVLFFIDRRRAGPFAIGWMALVLLVCFLPSTLNLAALIGGENTTALWALRIGFFIVEAVIVFFIVRLLLAWDEGRPIYLILASACVSLIFATKETGFITLGTMLLAILSVWVWRGIRESKVFESNWFKIVAGLHVAGAIALVVSGSSTITDSIKWLSTGVHSRPSRPAEPFAYYSIIFLLVTGAVAWALFINAKRRRLDDSALSEPARLTVGGFAAAFGAKKNALLITAAVFITFAYLFVLFFSSFFTYAEGVGKAFEAYAIWTKTGNKDHTMSGYLGYLKWAIETEASIFIISFVGALMSLLSGRHRFAMFTAFWAFGLFAAYSIIPYKTPWLALSFLLPMCILAGYALNEMLASRYRPLRIAAGLLAASGVALLTYQSYQLNFVRYDDEDLAYVYAHTRRGFLDMMREIERYAEKSGKGTDATIEIVSPDYWPMTWYVNDYKKANFHGSLIDASTAEMIVMKKNDQDTAAIQKYSAHYKYVGVYPLRPGVNLVLLVRRDLADPNTQELNKLLEYKIVPGYTD